MTRAVGDDDSMLGSLRQVATLFEEAQNSVFKLMASVSLVSTLSLPLSLRSGHMVETDRSRSSSSLLKFFFPGFGSEVFEGFQVFIHASRARFRRSRGLDSQRSRAGIGTYRQ